MRRASPHKKYPSNVLARKDSGAIKLASLRRRADSQLRSLIHKSPAATFVFSGNKNRLVNPAAEALTGYDSKELLKMDFWQIVHPDYRLMIQQRGRARQRGAKIPPRYELKIVRKDGTERWLEYCGAAIQYRGEPAVIGTAIDITERKVSEERLRRNLKEQRLIHEATLVSMSTFDLTKVLEIFLDKVDALLPCPAATTIRVVDIDSGDISAKACKHIDARDWERWISDGGRALTERIWKTRSPVFVADPWNDLGAGGSDFFRQSRLASYLGLPLIYNDQVLGDISIYTRERHRFSDEEVEVLQNLASQAAIAIHNSHLYDGMKRKARALYALNTLTQTITQSLDLNAVLDAAVKSIVELIHFDGATVYVFNDVMTEASLKSSYFSTAGSWRRVEVVKIDEGIIGRVARTGAPVIFENIATDPAYAEQSKTQGWKNAGVKFFAAFPIHTKLKSWGALSCVAKSAKRLTAEEIDLLVGICKQIAIAIENASLFGSTAEKAKELSTLYAIAGISAQFVDMNALLFQSMRKLCEIFSFDAARIYVVDKATGDLRLAARDGIPDKVEVPRIYQKDQGLIGRVVSRGEPLAFEDMENDPEFHRLAARKTMLNAGYRAALFIPLKVRGENLGVMNLLSTKPRSFSPAELQLINATAYHLGIAVGNAHLFSQLRKRTEDLEKANRAKDEFLSIMSHELRTPVNVIMGYLGLITQGACGALTEPLETNLRKISTHAQSLLSMVESILTATSIEAGTVLPKLDQFDAAEFLDQLRSAYETPSEPAVEMRWNLPQDPIRLRTDAEKLRIILRNLIDNAIKFTTEGRITISAERQDRSDTVIFTVSDTGDGIDPLKISFIFEMFRQLDSSVTRPHGGIGLGLYIAKQLTELLGGRISVRSQPGAGSVFTVSLPLQS